MKSKVLVMMYTFAICLFIANLCMKIPCNDMNIIEFLLHMFGIVFFIIKNADEIIK